MIPLFSTPSSKQGIVPQCYGIWHDDQVAEPCCLVWIIRSVFSLRYWAVVRGGRATKWKRDHYRNDY